MATEDTFSRGRSVVVEQPFLLLAGLLGILLLGDILRRVSTGDLAMAQLLTYIWDGLVVGLSIGLAGIGLSMTYSILNFANFSHGDYVTAGAFSGWGVTWLLAGLGTTWGAGQLFLIDSSVSTRDLSIGIFATPLQILAGLVVAVVATIGLALLLDRIVYRPMRNQEGIALLIASIGVALALRYIIVIVFGEGTRGLTAGEPSYRIPIADGVLTVSAHQLTLVAVAVVLMLGVHVVLQRTKLGKAMRAMADNEDLARVTGIPTERVIRYTWIIGAGLAGASGFLIALERGTLSFQVGWLLLLLIFAAVIMGGIGSIYGAMFGGVIIGVAQNLSYIWLPTDFGQVAAFLLMILVLLFRPSGLFGGKTTA
jgi:branched-chain amino acid transport system permease protein